MDESTESQDVATEEENGIAPMEPEKEILKIQIVDVENPAWVSMNGPFPGMVNRFVDHSLKNVPSITQETLMNYFATIVEGIFRQKITGVHENLIQSKFQVGFINNILVGFQLFHMLPNRLPHVQTLNWAYIYSEHPRITRPFVIEVQKYKKKWGARYISALITNERIEKIIARTCGKPVHGGSYYTAKGVNDALIG